ncbi:MAG: NUDIX hydrolase N-terminal domain-containing protein [Erysipelotrichaceae bacterium]
MNSEEFFSRVLAIAKTGIIYSKDPYALENYHFLQDITLKMLNDNNIEINNNIYEKNVYPTPSSSVRVIVFNGNNELLMVEEASDSCYSVPGGWCDVFESLVDNAIKEVREETGFIVEVDRLLAIFQREKYKDYKTLVSEYVHYFAAHIVGGEICDNHEVNKVVFVDVNNLPELSKKCTIRELSRAIKVYNENGAVDVD